MKFFQLNKEEQNPSMKYKRFFAIWPMTIGKETRWCEMVNIAYKRHKHYPLGDNYFLLYKYYYRKEAFLTDTIYNDIIG